MKVTYSVVLLFAILVAACGYPANNNDEKAAVPDKDIDFVPLEGRHSGAEFPPGGVVDVDAGGFFGNPFVGNPFPSLLGSIEGLMARMRQQLSQILGRLPDKPGDSPFPELHLPNLGDIDLGKGNTSSVTKVIDGHKVTINETEYKQDGENGAAFFKVRIIDVHPDSEEASTEKDSEAVGTHNRDRESVEDTLNNEIPKTKDNEELNLDNIETFDEVDIVPPHKYINVHKNNLNWDHLRSVESIEDNSIDAAPQPVRDLSNDIYVNQLMADAGVSTNPDAEVFDVIDGHMSSQYYPQVKPEKIMAINYVPPQVFNVPMNYPTSDFDKIGMQAEPMPVYSGMPFYVPPTFAINNQQYSLPIEHFVPPPSSQFIAQPYQSIKVRQLPEEKILVQPLPALTKQETESMEKNGNQQGVTTNKIVLQTSAAVDDQKQSATAQKNVSSQQTVEKAEVKQFVSPALEQQTKSSNNKAEEVSQKGSSSISGQLPSPST